LNETEELSHQEIAQQQEISYQNVCKRIFQARKILREELKEYFRESFFESNFLEAALFQG
jgi:DNA-directed RNA polymerase specialized sigma24 family protein